MAKLIDNEQTNKVLDIASSVKADELINKIKDFTSKFEQGTNYVPEKNTSFERLDNIQIDDEKIKKQAEDELLTYKKENYDKIINATTERENELLENKANLKENYDSAVQNVSKQYEQVRETVSNDALKRGLQRSSIVINKLDAFNQDELATYSALNKELTDSLNEIDFELNSLEAQQELALSNFDIEYAVKLNNKISGLKQELLDKQTEITKYNNQIAEKEADFDLKYEELKNSMAKQDWNETMDLMEYQIKYGNNAVERYKQSQIYSIIDNYLANLSTAEAKSLIENNETLRNYLTSQNLNSLLTKYS